MTDKKIVAYIIHLRDESMILSKVRYPDWHDIQDDYEDFMTSLGPWDVDSILSHFQEEYKEESSWFFTRDQIQDFMRSDEYILRNEKLKLTDIKSKSTVTLQFNNYINSLDLEGLSSLMTDDHTFIDSENDVHDGGRDEMTDGWCDFFKLYPDYRNIFERIDVINGVVIMVGYSICPNEPVLDGPAIWSAKVRDGLVAEWRVYLDTVENRNTLGIK